MTEDLNIDLQIPSGSVSKRFKVMVSQDCELN